MPVVVVCEKFGENTLVGITITLEGGGHKTLRKGGGGGVYELYFYVTGEKINVRSSILLEALRRTFC